MRAHDIESVRAAEKSFKIDNFKTYTKSFENVTLFKDGVDSSYSSTMVCNFTTYDKPTAIRVVGDRIFVAVDGGAIYESVDGKPVKIVSASVTEFEAEKVLSDGESKVLLTFPGGVNYLVGKNSVARSGCTIYSAVHATLGDRIFFGLKNKIVFDCFSELDELTEDNAKSVITLPDEVGEIIALIGRKKKMLVFCEKAVYELSVFGAATEYEIKRLLTFEGVAAVGSVCAVGDDVLLVMDDALYVYSDGNLNAADTVTDIGAYAISGKAATTSGKYILPLKKGKKYYLFVYGKGDSSEQLILTSNATIADGGYFIGSMTVNKLEGDGGVGTAKWVSENLDFGSVKLKSLKEITLKSNREITLNVKGEFGSDGFYLMDNVARLKLNSASRYYTVTITGEAGISISDLQFVYRIKEE